MLLAYRDDPSFFAVAHALGVHHQTVQRSVERALAYGPMAALDDRPRSGKEPTITAEAKAWLVSLACRKAKELGYPHELWTTRLLARHAREHGPAEGHGCLAKLVQGTVCKILNEQEVKPHKVRYYLERRDPEFKAKMAEVLCIYREVKIIKETAAAAKQKPSDAVAIVSYDEKPGIQAIATTAPDLSPEPGLHATFARDHEYKRNGTVSLLAGIDLLTGKRPAHKSGTDENMAVVIGIGSRPTAATNWRLRRCNKKTVITVGGGDATISSCGPIAPLVGRRARKVAARLDIYRPSPCSPARVDGTALFPSSTPGAFIAHQAPVP
jgi:transposase